MRVRFRRVKDWTARPLHWAMRGAAPLPRPVRRVIFGGVGLVMKGYYFAPGSHVRRTLGNLCRVIGRDDPWRIYSEMMGKVGLAMDAFGQLLRRGPEALAATAGFDEAGMRCFSEAYERYGGAIVVVPHCVGSVLSAAAFGRAFPTVLLVRESRSATRGALVRQYLERLGPELVFVRGSRPETVARHILRALRAGKLIVGTTDLVRDRGDTVEAAVFGERGRLPAWPARFAARRGVPVIPAYVRIEDGRVVTTGGEAYLEDDLEVSTQRWWDFFEGCIGKYPSEWIFMFEKRWARILAQAFGPRPRD